MQQEEESLIRHLEMIQAVITRMARNSFLIKGWAVTLMVGMWVASGRFENPYLYLFALIPTLLFWFLDGYYLWQERLFRGLYDYVRQGRCTERYSMSTQPILNKIDPHLRVICSRTVLPLYAVMVTICFIVFTIVLIGTQN